MISESRNEAETLVHVPEAQCQVELFLLQKGKLFSLETLEWTLSLLASVSAVNVASLGGCSYGFRWI